MHFPQDTGLPAKTTAKEATADSVGAANVATAAVAGRCVGMEAIISAASSVIMAVRAVVTPAVYFHGRGRRFQRFRGAPGNGKSAARYECRRQNGGRRYNEFFHLSPTMSKMLAAPGR